jgi:hypothetical protein
METAPAPAPPILDGCRITIVGERRPPLPRRNVGTLHGRHARRTWVDLKVKNPKAPVVTREVEHGLGAAQTVTIGEATIIALGLILPPCCA